MALINDKTENLQTSEKGLKEEVTQGNREVD